MRRGFDSNNMKTLIDCTHSLDHVYLFICFITMFTMSFFGIYASSITCLDCETCQFHWTVFNDIAINGREGKEVCAYIRGCSINQTPLHEFSPKNHPKPHFLIPIPREEVL